MVPVGFSLSLLSPPMFPSFPPPFSNFLPAFLPSSLPCYLRPAFIVPQWLFSTRPVFGCFVATRGGTRGRGFWASFFCYFLLDFYSDLLLFVSSLSLHFFSSLSFLLCSYLCAALFDFFLYLNFLLRLFVLVLGLRHRLVFAFPILFKFLESDLIPCCHRLLFFLLSVFLVSRCLFCSSISISPCFF